EGDVTISIYSGAGQIMTTENIGTFVEGNHQYKISTEDLTDGIYFVQVKAGSNQKVVKVVKK
ncbi:MAG: T9SS type A sorting domain-containing protein, partial [Salinivirgaceae bacterium]|nr:T9SS type A sorting domain-containing protein [Salinivirgaceae bacterium]